MNKRLGDEITRAMTKAKLSSPALARRAKVGDSWIRQVRGGRIDRPAPDKLRRIALELGLDESVVLGMTDQLGAAGAGEAEANVSPAAYLARIDSLVAELQADRKLIARLIELVAPEPPPYDPEQERADVRAAEEAAARERPETTSRRRRSDPAHRPSDSPRAVREGGGG